MSSNYQGVGYPGDDNFTLQGPDNIQQYLQTVGSLGPSLLAAMQAEEARIIGNTSNNYASSYFIAVGIPRSLLTFVTSYREYLYEQIGGTVPPAEQTFYSGDFYTALVSGFANQINQLGADFDGSILDGALPSAHPGSTVYENLYLLAFNNFAASFRQDPTNPASPANQFNTAYTQFNQRIVQISLSLDPSDGMNYVDILKGFTGLTDIPDSIFVNFVTKMIDQEGYFTPSGSFNEWVSEAVRLYVESYTGSPSQAITSVGATSSKTLVLNRIFRLLVDIIESLQKVTSAQSDRLRIFTEWQAAYGRVQDQIHYITKDDANATLGDDDSRRSEYNSYNATLVEVIKARKASVDDDSKNLQTQINQSNDSVNQQISMATSIIQELGNILSALYR